MSTADSQLEFDDLRPEGNGSGEASAQGSSAEGASSESSSPLGLWLNGDVVACACPDCGSPMTIRLWLMAADCWVCGASVVLSEEQQREVERLLDELEARRSAEMPAPAPEPEPDPSKPAPPLRKKPQPREEKPKPFISPVPQTVPVRQTAAKGNRLRKRLSEMEQEGEVTLWFRDLFRTLPAWLTSAILHMALLILLALVFDSEETYERPLILSTKVGPHAAEGGEPDKPEPDPVEFEKKGDEEPKEKEKQPEPAGKEEEPKEDPPRDPGNPEGKEPDPKFDRGAPRGGGALAMRASNPKARAKAALREGATTASEAAVARGLEWLARHQSSDGRWSLHAFHRAGTCRGRCRNRGTESSDTAATALALLPFLGAGQTHVEGKYQDEVRKGLTWLISQQRSNGDLRGRGSGRMYAHGQAAIALCEAFALTRDESLRTPAQLSIDFIVRAQHSAGGWRYSPGQPGDVSVVGWQVMALRSAKMGYLDVPDRVLERTNRFLDSCETDDYGGLYTYQPHNATPLAAMTAEGLLCRQYAGWPRTHRGLATGCRWMLDNYPPQRGKTNMYYWYYATQVMHHMGGRYWHQWNSRMRDLLVSMQETRGHEAGSWAPRTDGNRHFHNRVFDNRGGRLYMTALAICTLEVYYRHLPLYRSVAVE